MDECVRVLLITFPGQGHINPSLQFAKRLAKMGINVTYVTTVSAINQITKNSPNTQGLTFFGFSDGYDDGGWKTVIDLDSYMDEFKSRGSEALGKLITSRAEMGQHFMQVVYSTIIPWAGQVAHALHVPSTLLWNQPATVLAIYYYYFHGYGESIGNNMNDPSWSVELPGLLRVTGNDLPSYLIASNTHNFAVPLMKQHIDILDAETNPKVLVNSFDVLEYEALRAIEKIDFVSVGPLMPSAFLDGKDSSDTSFGGDLFHEISKSYIDWLNSKTSESVVYVAFGSLLDISKQQMEEIARGLLDCGRPFLWIVRATEEEKLVSFKEKLEQGKGIIVPWCSQVAVLSHPSVGCFVCHCGWNSSLESLVSGIPVVAFPQWSDQATNGKLIEDFWKTGIRVKQTGDGIIEGDEIKRCIEHVMGEDEMRSNAKKWKDLAKEAGKEDGSSYKNLKNFVDEVKASRVK